MLERSTVSYALEEPPSVAPLLKSTLALYFKVVMGALRRRVSASSGARSYTVEMITSRSPFLLFAAITVGSRDIR